MKKYLLLLPIISTTAFANDNLNSFIPKNFRLIESYCQADFNKDGQKDCVLLIKDTKKSAWETNTMGKLVDRNRRGIVILFKTQNGYQKILENKALFASENEEGGVYYAPELEIETRGNKLRFNYEHGRYGSWTYLFDYRTIDNKTDFYLIGYDLNSNHGPYINYTQSVNFLTGKYRHQENLDKERKTETPKFKTTWYDLPKNPVVKLKDIEDIDGFGYELESLLYQIGNPND